MARNVKVLLVSMCAVLLMFINGCASTTSSQSKITDDKTNVIIIVADQMRRASLGIWQQDKFKQALNGTSDYVVTPNLDQLANQGVLFTQAIANYPLCSPFRAMLLSGRYPNNNGVTNNTRTDRPNMGLRTDIKTMTEVFKENNYNTALVGKGHWHNNLPLFNNKSEYVGTTEAPGGHFFRGTRYDTYIPPGEGRHGIEYWYQVLGHNHDNPVVYTNDTFISGKPEGHPYSPKRYSAVDQADVIIDYIENTRKQRDSSKPFSLIWTMDPPHSPYKEMEDTDEAIYNKYYKDIDIKTLLNRQNVDLARAEKFARFHFSMVTLIDREIGRVLQTLAQTGLSNNTLIVFTSDHGEMMGSHGLMTKNIHYEESLSIPLIIHQPSKMKHKISDILFSVPDFMPTILALVGLEDFIPTDIDGTDFSQQIISGIESPLHQRQSSLYYGKSSELGLRTDRYTYIIDKEGQLIALFDNIKDPYQLTSLRFTDIPDNDQHMLKQELGKWLKHINHDWYQAKLHEHIITYPREVSAAR